MPRDRLLLAEMIDAGERIVTLAGRVDPHQPGADRDLLDALLWNRIVHGYWSVDLDILVSAARDDVPGLVSAQRDVAVG